jgi:hypothetical protein
VLGGTDVGAAQAQSSRVRQAALARALSLQAAQQPGLTGIPVVDDFLNYIGTPQALRHWVRSAAWQAGI